jgi:hypothetical protein
MDGVFPNVLSKGEGQAQVNGECKEALDALQ